VAGFPGRTAVRARAVFPAVSVTPAFFRTAGIALFLASMAFPVFAQAPVTPQAPAGTDAAVAAYNAWARAARSLRSGGKAVVGAPDEHERTFRFALVLAAPDQVRLQGRWGNLTTLFDLAAQGDTWTLHLPRERKVVHSDNAWDRAGLLLPPREITAALLPRPLDPARLRDSGAVAREGNRVRVVMPPRGPGDVHRVLWLDAATGLPDRVEVRRATQLEEPVMTVRYRDYRRFGDALFPAHVDVRSTGGWAVLDFESVKLGESLDPRRFTILLPPGTREVPLSEVDPGFLPEAGAGDE